PASRRPEAVELNHNTPYPAAMFEYRRAECTGRGHNDRRSARQTTVRPLENQIECVITRRKMLRQIEPAALISLLAHSHADRRREPSDGRICRVPRSALLCQYPPDPPGRILLGEGDGDELRRVF